MTKIIFTQENINNIINRYNQGESSTKIATIHNCNYKIILRLLNRYNIPIRKQKITLSLKQQNDIVNLYQSKSIKEIATIFNIPPKHVTLILKKYNVEVKPSHSYTSFNLNNLIINDFYQNKLNYQQIAIKNNCSTSLVKKLVMQYVKNNNLPCYVCDSNQNLYKNNKRQIVCNLCKQKISRQKRKSSNQRRNDKRKIDPCKKISHNFSSMLRNQLKSNKIIKQSNTFNILGYSTQDLKNHLESQFESWMTWNNYGRYNKSTWDDNDLSTWTWQIDHIQPLSTFKFNSTNDSEFRFCWSLNNLRPLNSKQNYLDGVRRARHK